MCIVILPGENGWQVIMTMRKITVALAALLPVASGCNWPERSAFDRPRGDSRINIQSAEVASAPDAPEPAISAKTHFRAGRFHESTRNFDQAIEQYRFAIKADNTFTPAYDRLGMVQGFLGRYDEADRTMRRAIIMDPGNSGVRNNLGFLFMMREQWPAAGREFRRALQMNPQFDRARINLGLALAAQGDFDEAFKEFRRVLPEADAQYNLGLSYRAAKRYDDARRTFEYILAMNPRFEAARKQLAQLPRPRADKNPSQEQQSATDGNTDDTGALTNDSFNSLVTPVEIPVPLSNFEQDIQQEPAAARKQSSLEHAPLTPSDAPAGVPGDLNGDDLVDMRDFAGFQKCIATGSPVSESCRPADLNRDGYVDLTDYFDFHALVTTP